MLVRRFHPPLPILRRLLAVLLVAGLCAHSTLARAQDARGEADAPPQEAIEAYQRARTHYKAGRYPEAIEQLERALELDPESVDLVYNVARVYELMGELGKAVVYYERYRSMLPPDDTEERERVRETIARLRGAQDYVSATAPPTPPPQPSAPLPVKERGVADAAVWTFTSVALVGLGAGAFTGGFALKRESEANDFVLGEDGDVSDRDALRRKADRLSRASDGLLGAGAGLAVAALLLYALREQTVSSAGEQRGDLKLRPRWSAFGAGLAVEGTF